MADLPTHEQMEAWMNGPGAGARQEALIDRIPLEQLDRMVQAKRERLKTKLVGHMNDLPREMVIQAIKDCRHEIDVRVKR